jgi:hypothetical protein
MSVLDAFAMGVNAVLALDMTKTLVVLVLFSFLCLWAMVWEAWKKHVLGAESARSSNRKRRKKR